MLFKANYTGGIIIQKCVKCKANFSYVELLSITVSFSGYKEIKYKHCNALLRITNLSKLIMVLLIALPLFFQNYWFDLGIYMIVFYLIYLTVIHTLFPFIVKYELVENE